MADLLPIGYIDFYQNLDGHTRSGMAAARIQKKTVNAGRLPNASIRG